LLLRSFGCPTLFRVSCRWLRWSRCLRVNTGGMYPRSLMQQFCSLHKTKPQDRHTAAHGIHHSRPSQPWTTSLWQISGVSNRQAHRNNSQSWQPLHECESTPGTTTTFHPHLSGSISATPLFPALDGTWRSRTLPQFWNFRESRSRGNPPMGLPRTSTYAEYVGPKSPSGTRLLV
jgi:hypothetical protein